MTCGFTGTQHGMTPRQLKAVRQLLWHINQLHLGDCIGADAQAYAEAVALGVSTIAHPPTEKRKRAFLTYDFEREPKPYLDRNKQIALEGVDGLIAAPFGYTEELRSGTWATVRYARNLTRPIKIVLPNGTIVEER